MAISDNLKQLIKNDKCNMNQISEKSGVDRRTFHSIIKNENKNPRVQTAKKIADYFEITIEELIK